MGLKIDPWSVPDPEPATESAEAGNTIVLAGGCFWCTEAVYRQLDGVLSVRPGYAGGSADTANYEAVCSGTTGHAEVIEIVFDPARVDLGQILKIFFSIADDPTQLNRQGADVATQYRSAIFHANEAQRRRFDGWYGDAVGGATPYFLTMDGAKTVTANFTLEPMYSAAYSSFLPESLALDIDNKGATGRYVKRSPHRSEFRFHTVVPYGFIDRLTI